MFDVTYAILFAVIYSILLREFLNRRFNFEMFAFSGVFVGSSISPEKPLKGLKIKLDFNVI